MLKVDGSHVSMTYDKDADVLYLGFGRIPTPPSYSIGNPAQDADVEWMVAIDDPEQLTGAMVMNWRRRWASRHQIPPLPCAIDWDEATTLSSQSTVQFT
jgi:hypothetical protein